MSKPLGSFNFVLHSHIPYVLAHGISPHGTDWLSEAAAECYLPLLDVCNTLIAEGISPKITVGLTPVLVEQLADPWFKDEFASYLKQHVEQASADQREFRASGNYHQAYLARFWEDWYADRLASFEAIPERDIIGAFKRFQDDGHVEIISSSATHGYSPLLSEDATIQAQVKTGIDSYVRHFGRRPVGYWLPECGYRPRYEWRTPNVADSATDQQQPYRLRKGVEEFLAENGIRYFFADSQLLQGTEGLGVYGDRFDALTTLWADYERHHVAVPKSFSPYCAYRVNSSDRALPDISVFSRDPATGLQVWSAEHGYPGDSWYLEFHKKHDGLASKSLGLRYWRVTRDPVDPNNKALYEPHRVPERIADQADHFVSVVRNVLATQAPDGHGIVNSVYDTELFGHWWFEGPQFLYDAIKRMAAQPDIIRQTCSDYLTTTTRESTSIQLPEGSWGQGGFHWIWLNQNTAWVWDMVYKAESAMKDVLSAHGSDKRVARLLRQAARELLLITSSDWPFCISTGGAADYAAVRVRNHFDNFSALIDLIRRVAGGYELTASDRTNFAECEDRDRLFPHIDIRWFDSLDYPTR